ncbi:hypothetical protein [Leptospira interrogans]|uniref:Uncharacterized protein n=1 Tax=Leptospira interrogans serovar Canicola TaxID=211880 RepID=A0AAP9W957_LEPIR|nr:hypothetical protein [Leptospira interrogans]KAA1289923.1 hypothetical protein C4X99_05280 [Leptospira interrogans serovar Geyaweera]QOI41730.1 hypothetical protein Lepto782_05230 [Leptospira interrogans serovar Canicola]QOI41749.1 hypothetical protein Lepto782_05340 [Leptospira interrogans serovar Canicola]UML82372.1 hypothetical protein FH587_00290 [Leptospira interrogans]UML82390.1 hypothetical protein FH587_00400 [Leptospira interrogans]
MKVLLDIKDSKAHSLLEILKGLSFVKFKILNEPKEKDPTKDEILEGIQQGLKEAKLIRSGKLKAKSMEQLLDEL